MVTLKVMSVNWTQLSTFELSGTAVGPEGNSVKGLDVLSVIKQVLIQVVCNNPSVLIS